MSKRRSRGKGKSRKPGPVRAPIGDKGSRKWYVGGFQA